MDEKQGDFSAGRQIRHKPAVFIVFSGNLSGV